MKLTHQRFSDNGESTLGLLYIDGKFECYIIEDTYHTIKIKGKTRIPSGTYKLELRNDGGKTKKYKKRFPDMHVGMLWLRNIQDFTYVYIHIGNSAVDSLGCLLTGDTINNNIIQDGFLGSSTAAYKRLYKKVAPVIKSGEYVYIEVIDEKMKPIN